MFPLRARRPLRWALAALLVLGAPGVAGAQDAVSVRIRPSATSVDAGDVFQVFVNVDSEAGDPEAVSDLPASGFRIRGSSQSQSMQFSLGWGRTVQRVNLQITYVLQAVSPGTYTVGPVVAQVAGRRYASNAVQIQVGPGSGGSLPGGVGPLPPPGAPGGPVEAGTEDVPFSACRRPDGSALPESGADGSAVCVLVRPQLFLQITVSDLRVYLGEPLRMQIAAYVDQGIVGFSVGQLFGQLMRGEPSLEGFLRTNLESPQVRIETARVRGTSYATATLRDKLLYPTRVGRLEIGPAAAVLVVRNFFDLDEVRRTTARVPIDVLPLPPDGRPAGFSPNNVGAGISATLAVAPTSVRAGEPIEATLTFAGEGNLAGFRIDPPAVPGASVLKSADRVVEPTADRLTGSRSVAFVVTPSAPGEIDLAGLVVPYFDYVTRSYAVAAPAAVKVAVAPAPPGAEPAAAPQAAGAAARPATVSASMRPWDDLGPKPSPLHRHPLFWALLGLPPASLAGLYAVVGIARARRRRRGTVRPQDVFRRSEATLRRTARGRSREEPATQIAAVEGALLDYLEARLGEPLRGYAAGELCRRLVAAGFPEATVDRLAAQLEACAFGRFAPSASRRQGAEETARAALDLLRDLESAGGSAGGNHE